MLGNNETIDCWAIVELMGHQRIAGRITERTVAGVVMLQVYVPAIGEVPEYTRMLGGSAIYAINPCDEEVAIRWAKSIGGSASPIVSFESKHIITRMVEERLKELTQGAVLDTGMLRDDDDDQAPY